MLFGWDTETCPIRPGWLAPPLVCLSWADQEGNDGLLHRKDVPSFFRKEVLTRRSTLVNAAFDLGVVGSAFPELMTPIFDHLLNDGFQDAMLRQKMVDIAYGKYSTNSKPKFWRPPGADRPKQVRYNLSDMHHYLCGSPLEKDEWRMRYAEFHDLPIDQWPEGAKRYAIDDAHATVHVHAKQDEKYEEEIFIDEFRQVRGHFGLHLIACWGIRTDPEAIERFGDTLTETFERTRDALRKVGIVRESGSRNMKLVKAKMFADLGVEGCKLTKKGDELYKQLVRDGAPKEEARRVALTENDHKYVSTDAESCEDATDAALKDYHEYSHVMKLRSTYIPLLTRGVQVPIQTYFESLLESGRTSTSPNIQNMPRAAGVRECFVPRPGTIYVGCDYDLAELRSLAQVCLDMLGYSSLAQALNAGMDPHLMMAAELMGSTYEEALHLKKNGSEEEKAHVKEMRTLAKALNFGFPGGLGAKTFCAFAKGNYGLTITQDQAKELKKTWLATWPEMQDYFSAVNNMMSERVVDPNDPENTRTYGYVKQVRSQRLRGRVSYTQCCNTFFQGLTADATKDALFEIARHQFCVPESPLYGTHTVNFIHDEYILEAPVERAHEVAMALRDIMVEVYNRWTPDVPMTAEPYIMHRWHKDAEAKYNKKGRLIPCDKAA